MAAEPSQNLRMFVGGVIVDNGMDDFAGRYLGFDGIEEADKLLMAVTLHVAADHAAVENVQRSEERRCAVTLVIVGHGPASAGLHRKTGLGAVESLDLALFV